MITVEQLRVLFPAKVEVTQAMIDIADVDHCRRCIGALALKKALGDIAEEVNVSWGDVTGMIYTDSTTSYHAHSNGVQMMEIKEPITVILNIVT